MTLKELFEEHGQVWLASNHHPDVKSFKPLGLNENGYQVIGENNKGEADEWNCWDEGFVLYQPKPKTVKKWQYYVIDRNGLFDTTTHLSDQDFENCYDVTNLKYWEKLKYSEISVPQ